MAGFSGFRELILPTEVLCCDHHMMPNYLLILLVSNVLSYSRLTVMYRQNK